MTAISEIFGQVLILFAFAAVGFGMAKGGVVDSNHAGVLSKLLVYVFLPCNVFKTFANNFNVKYIKANWQLLVTATCAICVISVCAYFAAKLFSKNKYEQGVYEYSLAIPNSGYMGYPLAEVLIGQTGLMHMMLFAIPVQCYIYTYGYARLTKRRLTPRKLVNSVTVSMVLGLVFGISGLKLPEVPLTFLTNASACMGPISMLLAGIVISEFGVKPLFSEKRAYVLSVFRLVAAPLFVGGLAYLVFGREIGAVAALYFGMPCGLNTIVFAKAVGEPCKSGAALVFVSTVLACITIPAVLFLFGIGA